jgi:hypothetical protein
MVSGYEVKEIKKYSYSVFSSRYQENEVIADIMLSGDNVFYGYAHFLADGTNLPKAEKKFNLYNLYYHQKDLPAIIDMLRNESPVFIIFTEDDFKNCRITTMQEPVGEGEH